MSNWKPRIKEEDRNTIADITIGSSWRSILDDRKITIEGISEDFVTFYVDSNEKLVGYFINQFLMWNKLEAVTD